MEPCAYSLPITEGESGGGLNPVRQWKLKCPLCGLHYLLLIPGDARYPDQTYRDELMWRMGIDCPDHPQALVWDVNFTMPTAVRKSAQDSSPRR